MANAKVIYNTLVNNISLPESGEEIGALAFAVLQNLGVSKTDILAEREISFDAAQLESITQRLNNHEPLQYIFQEAWFYGRKFFVDNRVLIPRPETELLIDIVKKNFKPTDSFSLLDIGTGSGCIAVTLALEFPLAKVLATDVSPAALQVARKNADSLQASVNFIENNIMHGLATESQLDLIVSNPPYIAHSEKQTMLPNVLRHEPHLALFADANDPLIFYRAISKTALGILSSHGIIAVEINEKMASEVIQIFEAGGFTRPKARTDLFGKERVITALKA